MTDTTKHEPTVDLDELMALSSHDRVEIIDGELVEMSPVGIRHQLISGNIYNRWHSFVISNQLGLVFFDGLIYPLDTKARHLKGALMPDVSFVRKGMLPAGWDIDRPFPGAPTGAVEVVSPNDDPEALLKRIRMYLDAGTEAVWAVYPEAGEVHIYTADGAIKRCFDDMTIDMTPFMPGLTLALTDIFTLPELE